MFWIEQPIWLVFTGDKDKIASFNTMEEAQKDFIETMLLEAEKMKQIYEGDDFDISKDWLPSYTRILKQISEAATDNEKFEILIDMAVEDGHEPVGIYGIFPEDT